MAKVYIYGEIGESTWWNEDVVSAKSFRSDFDAAVKSAEASGEAIDVHINSPGGSVTEGIAIYNYIRNSGKEVNTIIDGIAYSMGAIIAMAGTRVIAAKNSTMLLHNAWGVAFGNVGDMEQTIELMKALDSNLAGTVADKTGLTEAEVNEKWFDYKDHTLTAVQAKEAGLIDELIGDAENVPKGSYAEVLAHFRSSKENENSFVNRIGNKVASIIGKLSTPEVSATLHNDFNTPMNIDNELLVLASVEATDKQKSDARAAIKSAFTADVVFTQEEVDTKIAAAVSAAEEIKNKEITSLQAEVKALGAAPAAEPTAKGDTTDVVDTKVDEVAALMAKGQANGFYKTSRIIND